jgi:acyl carrier protein
MIPSYFVQVEKIPVTPNGKIDRNALAGLRDSCSKSDSTYMAPKTDIERSIANVWRETLHLDIVALDDNFFDLGGNSIKIIQVSKQLQEELTRDIPVVILFKYPTIASLAEYLSQEEFLPQKQERPERTRKKEMGKGRLNKKRRLKLKN